MYNRFSGFRCITDFQVFELIEEASYYLERNANAKVIFMDLSVNIGRILKQKSKVEA